MAEGRERGMNRQSTEDFRAVKITLYDVVMMDTYLYVFVQTHKIYNTSSEQ